MQELESVNGDFAEENRGGKPLALTVIFLYTEFNHRPPTQVRDTMTAPSVFISYSHKEKAVAFEGE